MTFESDAGAEIERQRGETSKAIHGAEDEISFVLKHPAQVDMTTTFFIEAKCQVPKSFLITIKIDIYQIPTADVLIYAEQVQIIHSLYYLVFFRRGSRSQPTFGW